MRFKLIKVLFDHHRMCNANFQMSFSHKIIQLQAVKKSMRLDCKVSSLSIYISFTNLIFLSHYNLSAMD